MKHHLKIRRDGMIEFLSPPPIPFQIKKQTRRRFSEIVPDNWFLFICFRIIRFLFGEGKGRIPEFTRQWKCRWKLTILDSGHIFHSRNRQALVDLENEMFFEPKAWL